MLEAFASKLPTGQTISNGKAEYTQVITDNLSVVNINFTTSGPNSTVATAFYDTTFLSAIENETTISGDSLKTQKVDVVPSEDLHERISNSTTGAKTLQASIIVPSTVLEVKRSSCSSCDSKRTSLLDYNIVITLYENANLFIDPNLKVENRSLVSAILGASVVAKKVFAGDQITQLNNLPQNVTSMFSIAGVQLVSSTEIFHTPCVKYFIHRS